MIRALFLFLAMIGSAHAVGWRGASGGTIAASWVTDQTIQMPYTCSTTIWINPSTSPFGSAGGGSHWNATGTGSQAHPFLVFSDMYAGHAGTHIDAGTCVNLVASTPMLDDDMTMTSLPTGHKGGSFADTNGYAVLRSTDGSGNLVLAGGVGVTSGNTSAAEIRFTKSTGKIQLLADVDFWIFDGLNVSMTGAGSTQNSNACIAVGDPPLVNNGTAGPSHFQFRNGWLHGCGGAGINGFGGDWIIVQNNVCENTSGAPGFQESCVGLVVSQAGCAGGTYVANCPPIQTGVDATLCTAIGGVCTSYHHVFSGNWCAGNYEFGQPPNTSDGNCFIEDTNVIGASDGPGATNSGPYQFPTLVINNVIFSNGGRGAHCFISQHCTFVANTVYQNHWDAKDNASTRMNIDCFNANDCNAYNNIAYAIGPSTFVATAYSLGGTGPVQLDNVKGMIFTNSGAPPSGLNAMPVTMQDTTTNSIVAVTIDTTNTSTTAGGISGTVTFSGVVSVLNGSLNSVVVPTNRFASNASPLLGMFAAADEQSTSKVVCSPNWVQTSLPCSGGATTTLLLSGPTDQWRTNDWYAIEGATGADSAFATTSVPPTLTTAPGNNLQATDPLFTNGAFTVRTDYIMATLPTKTASGSGYSAGCLITLAGGSPTTAAVVEVDSISGSAVNAFHLYSSGFYPGTGTTAFTQASATCGGSGATFSGGTFFQPFWPTSKPDLTLQGGSPAKAAGLGLWCPSQDFAGNARSRTACSMGAYE